MAHIVPSPVVDDTDLAAIAKATIVFAAALTLSLAASAGVKIGVKTLVSRHSELRGERAMANQSR